MGADIVDGKEAVRPVKKADLDVAKLNAAALSDRNAFQL
jgi:hypothetical protein